MENRAGFERVPVVIVGKDRTRMTCAVIDHIKAHVKNAKPFFICVSDRSRDGHDRVIENHLLSIGETDYKVLRTLPAEGRFGWGAAINIGLQCAFAEDDKTPFALVVDNDWLLQRDLDMEKYLYAFMFSDIGAISFKSVHEGTNVSLTERRLSDGSEYLLRMPKPDGKKFSFTAELGCLLITKKMYAATGMLKENCITDETEWALCNWYNSLTSRKRSEGQLWFATDKEMYHEALNGEGHVFTHVGIDSQHDGPHKWDCPEEYKYLSDDYADEQVCKGAVMNALLHIDEPKESEVSFWKRNKVLFATNNSLRENNPLLLSYLLVKRFAPDAIYVVPTEKYGGAAFPEIFEYGISRGFHYVVYFDADCFILSESNLRKEFIEFADDPKNIFGGMPDGGSATTRGKNPVCINPFLLFANLKRIEAYRKGYELFDFGQIDDRLTQCSVEVTHKSLKESLAWSKEWRAKIGAENTSPGKWSNAFGYENYHYLLCGEKVFSENLVYYTKCSDFRHECDEHGISTAVWTSKSPFPVAEIRTIDDIENEGLICIHTWYARLVLELSLEQNTEEWKEFNKQRIINVVKWVKNVMHIDSRLRKDAHIEKISWEKYFDRVFCIHYLPQSNKLPRLKRELERVGLLESPILEFRYTSNNKYDLDVCNAHKKVVPLLNQAFVNIILEIKQILEEAIYFKYSRILLIENDVAFLKDVSLIRKILDYMPNNYGLIQFDKFVNDGLMSRLYQDVVRNNHINDFFVSYTQGLFTSAACFALNAEGIQELRDLIDVQPDATDTYFSKMRCRKALAVPNMAIQVFSPGAWSIQQDGVEYMHKVYKNANVKYEDYNLPSGYSYGSLYSDEQEQGRDGRKERHSKFISVYAIAKNEASVAARWYECVKEADEVCVLDTGSTDNTVKILRGLGAKVTVMTYEDWSFAVARNDSMELVSPDAEILFTLDLDETIAPGWRKKLEDAWIEEEKKGNKPVGCSYKYIWSWNPDGTEAQSFSIRKIHARGHGQWKYRCHELLIGVNGYSFFLPDFVVEHHQNLQTNRSKYYPLLKKDAEEMPEDDRSAYYHARELMYERRWKDAIREFKRHLSLPSAGWRAERASSMRNIAKCYRLIGCRDEQELWLWKSAEEDPTNREATYHLGLMAMERKDYRTAVKVLKRCTDIEKPSLEYISDPSCWTAHPWFLYSQALWWTGHWDDAIRSSRKALEIEPGNAEVKAQYNNMKATRDHFALRGHA